MIEIRALGPVQVTVDGGEPPAELLWRKNLALLLYLARSPDGTRTREHLCGLLWAEKPETSARHSLNEALRVLRRVLGETALTSLGGQVSLAPDMVALDTAVLEHAVEREDWEAIGPLAGEFLEGFSVPDASDFEDWLTGERRHWKRLSVRALVGSTEASAARGDLDAAAGTAEQAMVLDPYSDVAAAAVIRVAALHGRRGDALAVYEAFADRLERDLGAGPEPATQRLADRIRLERTWRLPESLREPERSGRRAPLTGREKELGRLLRAWASCLSEPRPAVLAVEGEPGIGKTRLLEELSARARLDGAVVSAIRCVSVDTNRPGAGIIGLCRSGLADAPGIPFASAGALAAIALEAPAWAERFEREIDGASPLPLASAFGELVRAILAESPALVLIDDADHLDETTVAALSGALRDAADRPLAVALGTSSSPSSGIAANLLDQLGREQGGAVVRLKSLDHEAVRSLAARAMPDYSEAQVDRLARRVLADSAGLPLLVIELLEAVRHGLELEEPKTAWPTPERTLDQTMPGDLPDSIVGAIRIGFRRLTPDAQKVLAAASALEDRVDARTLELATSLDTPTVEVALDELEWQRWLAAEARGYSFVARINRQVVGRDMLTRGQRQRVLAAVGRKD